LAGQTAGYKGADKRLDVIATASAAKLTINDLADIDFAYSPPIGTANDAINMAAYTAENRVSGFSPSVTVTELDAFIEGTHPVFVDVRDIFAFEKSHIEGAIHLPLELLAQQINSIPTDRPIIVYDETGKKDIRLCVHFSAPDIKMLQTFPVGISRCSDKPERLVLNI